MPRHPLRVGERTFASKKQALAFYRTILDTYAAGESLSERDAEAVIDLAVGDEDDIRPLISGVCVGAHVIYKSTKCFYLIDVEGGHSVFSYTLSINGDLGSEEKFRKACRNCVSEDLRMFKIKAFSKRPVRCSVGKMEVQWEECQVDHKAPLTFSVIVRSFVVANNINIDEVEYDEGSSLLNFVDGEMKDAFKRYHRDMAVLRIVSSRHNARLSGRGRIKPSRKDGKIE